MDEFEDKQDITNFQVSGSDDVEDAENCLCPRHPCHPYSIFITTMFRVFWSRLAEVGAIPFPTTVTLSLLRLVNF